MLKQKLLTNNAHTHTLETTQVGEEGKWLARISHLMPTYLIWNENQSYRSSAHARRNRTHANRQTWKPNANRWTYIRLRTKPTHTGNQMPIAGLISDSKHTIRIRTANRWSYIHLLTHTKTKQKGRPERSAYLLPTYLIWYEDQGDVVPLRRDKGLS